MNKGNKLIWLIDDSKASNFLHSRLLNKLDADLKIKSYQSAQLAMADLGKIDDDQQLPQIIILDINMPGMDGWDFLKEVENNVSLLKKSKKIVIVMLTTSLNPDDQQRSNDSKIVRRYIKKPVDGRKLEEILKLEK